MRSYKKASPSAFHLLSLQLANSLRLLTKLQVFWQNKRSQIKKRKLFNFIFFEKCNTEIDNEFKKYDLNIFFFYSLF